MFLMLASRADAISVQERMDQIGAGVRARVRPYFIRQRVSYPPGRIALVAIKDELRLKVYAQNDDEQWHFIMQYEIAKLSGKPGPKLKAGDKQVPEGVYQVDFINPESKYWLSLALNYPNNYDRHQAKKDGRSNLGGDIMVHGWWFSTGCIAVGNTAAEDLFVLTKDTGIADTTVIISPVDFRSGNATTSLPAKPGWVSELYRNLEAKLNTLGSDGLDASTRLVAYADLAPPPPPEPTTTFGKILRALAKAAETSSTVANPSK